MWLSSGKWDNWGHLLWNFWEGDFFQEKKIKPHKENTFSSVYCFLPLDVTVMPGVVATILCLWGSKHENVKSTYFILAKQKDGKNLGPCCHPWVTEPIRRLLTSIVQIAAAAAKLLQSYPTLCDPIDGSSPGAPIPGILQARILEWVAISFSKAWKWKVKVKSLSCVWLIATPWTAAHQAPPSMGFSRQEYWSGVPLT